MRRAVLAVVTLVLVGLLLWWLLPLGGKDEEGDAANPGGDPSQSEPGPEEQEPALPEPEPQPEPPAEAVSLAADDWRLLLVNSTSPLPDDFSVELETITDIYKVDVRIADNVRRMFTAAKEDGIELILCSAHRSPEKQEENFNAQVQQYLGQGMSEEDAEAATAAYIAYPGASEHHTGLAVDIVTPEYQNLDDGFENTPAFGWLSENAHKYGFVLRYARNKEDITQISYEPWHYRYVGEDNAAAMKESGLCLEEYVARQDQLREQLLNPRAEDPDGEDGEDEDEPSGE